MPNVGLLDNSIIPMMVGPMESPYDPNSDSNFDYSTEKNETGTTVIINKYTEENNNDDTTVIIGED